MRYRKTTPCDNCPFRKSVKGQPEPVRLTMDRAREIGTTDFGFPCHKTTVGRDCDYNEDGYDRVATARSVHCAGFLVYREKTGTQSLAMRLAVALGLYDPSRTTTPKLQAMVVDHWKDIAFQIRPTRKRRA